VIYLKNYNIYPCRSNLVFENKNLNFIFNTEIDVKNYIENDNIYKTIFYNNLNNKDKIKNILKKELFYFFNKLNINKGMYILVVGLGNDNHTADSIGPKSIKHIKVNSHLKSLGLNTNDTIISALEPGVMGETGILTERIILSVVNEIKPDLVILIDSYVSNNIDYLNTTIEINNIGLNPGSGVIGINSKIDKNILNVPVLTIGVTTAIEIKIIDDKNLIPYILSSKDVDDYVKNISYIVGNSINEAIEDL